MTTYAHITRAQFRSALQDRLSDTTAAYWATAELDLYLQEALQTWGLLTGYWRDTGTFNSVNGTAFYDLSTLTNAGGTALLSRVVTDTTLSTMIQYHLLEPATGSTWTGTEQFTLNDVTRSLQDRRDAMILETGCYIARVTQAHSGGVRYFDVPDTIMSIKRLAWTSATTSEITPVFYDDISGQRSYYGSSITVQDIPITFSSSSVQPLRYLFAPTPGTAGTLDMLCLQSGAALTAGGIAVGVPDDMAWVVKWGALASMLGKEGPGQDLTRSYFCERRYRLGLELAKVYPTVINAQINGVDLAVEAIQNLDTYNNTWQSSTGTPEYVGSARNYIALAPCPNGVFSVLVDVVRKAPLPANDAAYLQIGREYIPALLDYCEHLAAFKSGGEEFRHTFRAADNFFNAALAYNQRLAAQHPAIVELIRQSTADDYFNRPRKNSGHRALAEEAQVSGQSDALKRMFGNA